MKRLNLYYIIQFVLISFAMACLVTAIATIIFGEDNFFQRSLYPFFSVVILVLLVLLKMEHKEGLK